MAATKQEKEIIRTVNVNGDTYGPGQEDELVDALKAHQDNQDEKGKFDHQKELERLEKLGSIVGFASVDDADYEDPDPDVRATRQKNAHLLQDKKPVQRAGETPPTMDDVRAKPDANVVAAKLSGGKEAAAADEGKLAKAEQEATEELEEAHVQQESEQVPAPDKATGAKAKKGSKAKSKR